jgi:hypothetical protein
MAIFFSYMIDLAGNFQLADGVARPIESNGRSGKITVSCGGSSLTFETQADGSEKVWRVLFIRLSETKLRIEDTVSNRDGIYVKVK